MTVTAASFRATFPEFADPIKYPDGAIGFWLTFAGKMLNADRWADILDEAVMLVLAHQMVMSRRNQQGQPGTILAPQASKSVDKVSVSYDTGAVRLDNAGHWGGTSYGMQFFQLMRIVGAGGMQL